MRTNFRLQHACQHTLLFFRLPTISLSLSLFQSRYLRLSPPLKLYTFVSLELKCMAMDSWSNLNLNWVAVFETISLRSKCKSSVHTEERGVTKSWLINDWRVSSTATRYHRTFSPPPRQMNAKNQSHRHASRATSIRDAKNTCRHHLHSKIIWNSWAPVWWHFDTQKPTLSPPPSPNKKEKARIVWKTTRNVENYVHVLHMDEKRSFEVKWFHLQYAHCTLPILHIWKALFPAA